MEEFKEFREYFKNVVNNEKSIDDLSDYFDEQADIIFQVLEQYTIGYENLINVVEADNEEGQPEKSEQETAVDVDDEILIALFEEYLKDDYEPPSDNLTGIQIHLWGLWLFYKVIKPEEIGLDSLLRLNKAILRLVLVASPATPMLGAATKKQHQKKSVKKAKKAQLEGSSQTVLDAYQYLKAEYSAQNSKKPFKCEKEKFTLYGFAEHLIAVGGLDLSARQIVRHLKILINNRHI